MQSVKIYKKIKIFWDIDGTLLQTHGAAAVPFANAVSKFAGQEVQIERKKLSGFTDYEIVFDLLEKADVEVQVSTAEDVLIHYGSRLLPELEKSPPKLLADVCMAFLELANFPHVEHFIGSGNSIRGAESKIVAAGLTQYFPSQNYFIATSTQISRDSVIQSAAMNIKMPTLVIGDSDRDIQSARNSNLSVLAVATGNHSYLELRKLKPDYLLDNSWTTVDLLEIISDFAKKI
jgi:phosphoglycolate phosphatase-like HAD superfamily hydrolase